MDFDDQLQKAGADARRAAADGDLPDLEDRRKTVRLRRGFGAAVVAAAVVILVMLPLTLDDSLPGIAPADTLDVPPPSVMQSSEVEATLCGDPSIVVRLDAMLAVVDLVAEWDRGRSGSLSGRLPAPPSDAECADHYRGDLGEGRFADALVFKVGGELFVTILPSPTQEGLDFEGEGASMLFNGELVYGLVRDGVFAGVDGNFNILLSFPYVEAGAEAVDTGEMRALLATEGGLVWVGEPLEGFPDELQADRLAYRWDTLAGQRADGSTWAFFAGQVREFGVIQATANGAAELIDVGLSAEAQPVLVYLVRAENSSTVLRTVDVQHGVETDIAAFGPTDDISVAATQDGYIVASVSDGCVSLSRLDRSGHEPTSGEDGSLPSLECNPGQIVSLHVDTNNDTVLLSYGLAGEGRSSSAYLAVFEEAGQKPPTVLEFEPLLAPAIAIDINDVRVVALMSKDTLWAYDYAVFGGSPMWPDPDAIIDIPAGVTDIAVVP